MNPPTQAGYKLTLRRIVSTAEPEFDSLFHIYTESIPASERKSAEQLAAMAARTDYCVLVALEAETVVGFAIAAELGGTEATLLEYMAVAPEQRGRGIGAWLFRATAAQPQLVGRFLLVEVDSDCTESPDNAERARRKAFYRFLGAKQMDGLRYRMPCVASALPPPMDLLVYRDHLPSFIEMGCVRSWLASCYEQVYGVPADDPRIETMLTDLPEQVALI